jgi:tRNA(His) guanylyltransferase
MNILKNKIMKDDLGTRMKEQYENRTRYSLPRRTYTIIRLDGKAFHTFTRGMKRPYDMGLMNAMDETAKFLCENIQGCKMAYTQSDEISLLLTDFEKITTDAWFDGNIQKMVSVAASMATAKFNQQILSEYLKNKHDEGITTITYRFIELFEEVKLANFDARVFTIPDPIEVENYFVWRQKDAVRNSVAMTAQSLYSHKELDGKSSSDQQEMIFQKGQNWNDMPEGFKRGRTFVYYSPGDVVLNGWTKTTPDFLKERETLRALVPIIINE